MTCGRKAATRPGVAGFSQARSPAVPEEGCATPRASRGPVVLVDQPQYLAASSDSRCGTVALSDLAARNTGRVKHRDVSSCPPARFRFPREVIAVAVRWYLRYGLSYRDVEELLAERGITVDHVSVYRWVMRFTPEFVEAARPARRHPGTAGSSMRCATRRRGFEWG
jgi:hypothetical protein